MQIFTMLVIIKRLNFIFSFREVVTRRMISIYNVQILDLNFKFLFVLHCKNKHKRLISMINFDEK
uniref:CSON009108 protein n=1 Tax=Culicoides sonorensis TaxID=179676 RepID=A0A336LGQ0_CULSO